MKPLLFLGLALCLIALGFIGGRLTALPTTEIRLPDSITPVIQADINGDEKADFVFDNNGQFTAFFSGDDNRFAVEKIMVSPAFNEMADCLELIIFVEDDVYSIPVNNGTKPLFETASNYVWR